jgi:Flp pilus assembly pilin Flp
MKRTVVTRWKRFCREEEGMGTLELLLILAVLVIIAIAFRKWIMHWVKDLFSKTNDNITNDNGGDGKDLAPSS